MKLLINDKPWTPFILIFIIVFIIIGIIGSYSFYCFGNESFDWNGVFTESIGMLFDVLFLGIIWAIFEFYRSKKLDIRRYKEDIDDFRRWESDEAMHKTVGNIRRLIRNKVSNIDLSYCHLKNAELWNLKLTHDAISTNFYNAKLAGSDLQNIDLSYSDFEKAHLYNSKLNGSRLFNTSFKGANLKEVDFRGCKDIDGAYFWGAMFIWEAKFDPDIDIEQLKNQKRKESRLGIRKEFFDKKKFIELNFNCTILEFHMSEYNNEMIVLRFTKEGFKNYKNLIKITGEHEHYFHGILKFNDLILEIKSEK